MARKDPRPEVSRRKFLAGAAVAGAAASTTAKAATPEEGRREGDSPTRTIGDRVGVVWRAEDAVVLEA